MSEFTIPENKGIITCTCCGKASHFGRVDKINIETKVQVLGECHDCLNKKADEIEKQEVAKILGLTNQQPNPNANPNPTPTDNGK